MSLFITICPSDEKGKIEPSFAYEVAVLEFNGITDRGIQFDIRHMDGEWERLALGGKTYGTLTLEGCEYVFQIRFTGQYPASNVVDRAEFTRRVGQGMLQNERGHYSARKET